jgi:hypothetical protein
MLKYSLFLTFFDVKMSSKTLFDVPKNDANKGNKDVAIKFLSLVSSGTPKDSVQLFAPDCRTHNPYVVGGIDELINAMIAVQKQGSEGIIKGSKADFNS